MLSWGLDSLWHLKDNSGALSPSSSSVVTTFGRSTWHRYSSDGTRNTSCQTIRRFGKMTRQNLKWAHVSFSPPIFIPTDVISLLKGRMETSEERKLEMKTGHKLWDLFVIGNEHKSMWLGAVRKQIHNRNNQPSHELHCSVCIWINSTKLLKFVHTKELQTLYLQIMISEWQEVKAAVNQ